MNRTDLKEVSRRIEFAISTLADLPEEVLVLRIADDETRWILPVISGDQIETVDVICFDGERVADSTDRPALQRRVFSQYVADLEEDYGEEVDAAVMLVPKARAAAYIETRLRNVVSGLELALRRSA